jgi:hypothetical protein
MCLREPDRTSRSVLKCRKPKASLSWRRSRAVYGMANFQYQPSMNRQILGTGVQLMEHFVFLFMSDVLSTLSITIQVAQKYKYA